MIYFYAAGVSLFLIAIYIKRSRASKVFLKIFLPDITCMGCVSKLERALKDLKSFKRIEADISKKEAKIFFSNSAVDQEKVLSIIKKSGNPNSKIKEYIS